LVRVPPPPPSPCARPPATGTPQTETLSLHDVLPICSTTTVLLQRMEKKELIYRQVSQKDARQKSVHLTQKAQDLVAECRSYFQLQEKELEERFSEDEIAIFEKILDYYVKKK